MITNIFHLLYLDHLMTRYGPSLAQYPFFQSPRYPRLNQLKQRPGSKTLYYNSSSFCWQYCIASLNLLTFLKLFSPKLPFPDSSISNKQATQD